MKFFTSIRYVGGLIIFLFGLNFSFAQVPDISVSPASFNVSINEDEVKKGVITITNNGTATLNFDISTSTGTIVNEIISNVVYTTSIAQQDATDRNFINFKDSESIAGGIKTISSKKNIVKKLNPPQIQVGGPKVAILASWNGSYSNETDACVDIANLLNANGMIATVVRSDAIDTITEILNYDVVIIGSSGQSGTDNASGYGTVQSVIRSFVENYGRGLVVTGWGVYTIYANNYTDYSAILPVNTASNYGFLSSFTLNIFDPAHPIASGVNNFSASTYGEYANAGVKTGASIVAKYSTGQAAAVTWSTGTANGKVAYLGPIYMADETSYTNEVLFADANSKKLLVNAVNWTIGQVKWLSFDVKSGSIPAGGSATVNVSFDATDLAGGSYNGNIVVSSNDPDSAQSKITIPASLTVTGQPDLDLSEISHVFKKTFVGYSDTDTLIVSNSGSVNLNVSNIVSSNPDFTVDSTSFNLMPGGKKNIKVTFKPTIAGIITGTLTISSNDPNENPAIVNLSGNSAFPPSITVSPDSFNITINENDSTTEFLTIGNTGTGELSFSISTSGASSLSNMVLPNFYTPDSEIENNRIEMRFEEKQLLKRYNDTSKERFLNSDNSVTINKSKSNYSILGGPIKPNAQLIAQFPDYSGNIHPMGIAFDGTYYWVVGGGGSSGAVAQLDKNFNLITTKTVNLDCRSVFYNPADGKVYIKAYTSNALYRLNTSPFDGGVTLIYSGKFQNSQSKVVISSDGKYLFDHYNGTVKKYNFADGSVVQTFTLALQHDLTSPRGNILANSGDYLLTFAGDKVYAYNMSTGAFVASSQLTFTSFYEWPISYTNGMFFITNTSENTWYAYSIDQGSAGWISVFPKNGIVAPGSFQNVNVKINSTGLSGGNYKANITVNSNDPVNSSKNVLTNLTVIGQPDIDVLPTSLIFRQTFVGQSDTLLLTIANKGSMELNVSNIISDNPEFTVDSTIFKLIPGAKKILKVVFKPTISGDKFATLTISSDDPDENPTMVNILAKAVHSPTISVTPASFTETLDEDTFIKRTMTITNSGLGDLLFNIKNAYSVSAMNATSVKISDKALLNKLKNSVSLKIVDENTNNNFTFKNNTKSGSGKNNGISTSVIKKFNSSVKTSSVGINVLVLSNFPAGNNAIAQNFPTKMTDVVIQTMDVSSTTPTLEFLKQFPIVLLYEDGTFSNAPNVGNVIYEYVMSGGNLILGTFYWQDRSDGGYGGNWAKLEQIDPMFGGSCRYTYDELDPASVISHPIMSGVNTIATDNSGYRGGPTQVRANATVVAKWKNGDIFVAVNQPAGRIAGISLAPQYMYYNQTVATVDFYKLWENAIKWAAKSVAPWLSEIPSKGVVAPNSNLPVEVKIDASDLPGGNYSADIIIESNDPKSPKDSVKVNITVNGKPDIDPSTLLLDFKTTFIGYPKKLMLEIANGGSLDLTVSNIVSGNPFTFNLIDATLPFTLKPDSVKKVEVTFTPTATGKITGKLTITSNDPNESPLDIGLSGDAVHPPVITVSPDSLKKKLNEGAKGTESLTINNTGLGDLFFEIENVYGTGLTNQPLKNDEGELINKFKDAIKIVNPKSEIVNPQSKIVNLNNVSQNINLGQKFNYSKTQIYEKTVTKTSNKTGMTYQVTASAYKHQTISKLSGVNILVYLDDYLRTPGNHYVEQALQALGLSYTAVYDNDDGFGAFITNGTPWNLIIVDHNNWSMPFMPQLSDYISKGGKAIITTYDLDNYYSTYQTFWNSIGVLYSSNVSSAIPVYWWDKAHLIFTVPETVPEFTTMSDNYGDDGDRMNTINGGVAIAGYTATSSAGNANIIISKDLMVITNSFLIADNTSISKGPPNDLDKDGKFDATELWTNEIGFILFGGNWLTEDPNKGKVIPGGSANVQVTFDASKLPPGNFYATIKVNSNDPKIPVKNIKAHLEVTPAPNILIDPPGLDFGKVYIGYKDTLFLKVRNTGSLPLKVSSIATNHSAYTFSMVGALPVTIGADSAITLTVVFTPPANPGLIEAKMTFVSDDPDQPTVEIILKGNAVHPPDINITQTKIDGGQVFEGGKTTKTLTIGNTGQGILDFDITNVYSVGVNNNSPVIISDEQITNKIKNAVKVNKIGLKANSQIDGKIVGKEKPVRTNSIVYKEPIYISAKPQPNESILAYGSILIIGDGGTETAVANILTSAGYNVVIVSDDAIYNGTNPSPIGFSGVVLLDGINYGSNMPESGQTALLHYVQNGGGLVVTEWIPYEFASGRYQILGPILPVFYSSYDYGTETYSVIADHPVTNGLDKSFSVTHGWGVQTAISGFTVISGSSSKDAVVVDQVGKGRIVVMSTAGNDNSYSPFKTLNMGRLLVNSVRWTSGIAGGWLSQNPSRGSVNPSSSLNVAVNFDAEDVPPGSYFADINVFSNDPDEKLVKLTANLLVNRAPDIASLPLALDFGRVLVPNTVKMKLVIKNKGSDSLIVNSVSLIGNGFTFTGPSSFMLKPKAIQEFEVNFAPANAGVFNASLNFASNDPDEASFSVKISGKGYLPPDINITQTQLNITAEEGKTGTQNLIIGNTGAGELNFKVYALLGDGKAQQSQPSEKTVTITVEQKTGSTAGGMKNSNNSTEKSSTTFATLSDLSGAKILFDESHNEHNYLDESDPNNFGDAWSLSGWRNAIVTAGGVVTKHQSGPITQSVLSGHDILVISMPRIPFTEDEIRTIVDFVNSGHGLLLMGEYHNLETGYPSSNEKINAIASNFGIMLNEFSTQGIDVTTKLTPHIINEGLITYSTAFANLVTGGEVVFYHSDGISPAMAVTRSGIGKVALITDTNIWSDNYGITLHDNAKLALSTMEWLIVRVGVDWLNIDPVSGIVAPNSSKNVVVTADANGLQIGRYNAILVIVSDDVDESVIPLDVSFEVKKATGITNKDRGIPRVYAISQNYPNPFNPETKIDYQIPKNSNVVLRIYNILGQEVVTLVNQRQQAGYYTAKWDGKDKYGKPVASGLYFYKIKALDASGNAKENFVMTKKMLILK